MWKLVFEPHHEQHADVPKILNDLFSTCAKFYFYYIPVMKDVNFAEYLYESLTVAQDTMDEVKDEMNLPGGHTKVNAKSMFVNEVIRHMRHLTNEDVLIQYLTCCQGMKYFYILC